MPNRIPAGARVELLDPDPDAAVLLPSRVRVNGTDVGLIAENGVQLKQGDVNVGLEPGSWTEPTTVTLVLFASSVAIRRATAEEAATL